MANALVVAEFSEGQLKKSTLSAITFAKKAAPAIGGAFDILVIGGPGAKGAADGLAAYGAGKILVCEDASLEHYVAENFAPTVADVGKDYSLVVATATTFGKDLIRRGTSQGGLRGGLRRRKRRRRSADIQASDVRWKRLRVRPAHNARANRNGTPKRV